MAETTTYRNALPAGAMLFEYRLESVLGAGAFGMTYLARDTHLDKQVAIKEYLPTELAVRALDGSVVPVTTDHGYNYQWGLDRFMQEARTLAKFSHPNVVRIYRYFEANGTGYMVMDYEQGASLAQLMRGGPLSGELQLQALLLSLLDGLEAVHAAGFLHRDVKPANVFVRANGEPVLLDFGAARQAVGGATKTLTSVLTPGYAPLEQYSSDGRQGPWTDIYALAGVAYRALLGENPPDAVSRIREDTVPRTLTGLRGRVGAPLVSALEWALLLDERKRPQDVREWRRAILGEAPPPAASPVSAPATAAHGRSTTIDKPGRFGWRSTAIGLLLAVVGAGLVAWFQSSPSPETASPAAGTIDIVKATPNPPEGGGHADKLPLAGADYRQERERPPRERAERPGAEEDPREVRLAALREFRSADTDGDGFLSPAEVRQFPIIAKDFGRVDADGDGRISAQEFVRLRELQRQQRLQR